MYIHADMRGVGTLLLALDGVLIGLVVEADTLEGWVRRYDTRALNYSVTHGDLLPVGVASLPPKTSSVASQNTETIGDGHAEYRKRVAACPIVRVEGKVDFVGDTATDPDWMIAQRLAAVRARHGLPIDVSVSHETSGVAALVLERLAAKLRMGSMVATDIGQTRTVDKFPIPDDKWQFQPTGRWGLSVSYGSPEAIQAYETAKAAWALEHPESVPEYVKRCTEGEAKIIEEVEATIGLRVRTALARK